MTRKNILIQELALDKLKKLQWVSEWRITQNASNPNDFPFKVTDRAVYTPAVDMKEAERIMAQNIESEKIGYIINLRRCGMCNQFLLDHSYTDMEFCILRFSHE